VFRIVNLNVRYYGCRAEQFTARERGAQIAITALSAVALALLMTGNATVRYIAAALAGLSAVLAAVAPFLGWPEKAREVHFLHRAHIQLFSDVESVIAEIRRDGLTEEHLGASKIVHAAFERLTAMDEPHPDKQLIDQLDEQVRAAFPPEYVWTNF
jgi:hypothetical protein